MRAAFVTGGTKNIGFAIAQALAAAGVAVAINGRSPGDARAAVELLRADGATAIDVVGDVAQEAAVTEMVATTRKAFGHLDILVNNAGIRCQSPLSETSLADWQAVLDTVLTGAFLTTRAALPGMCAAGWGRVVNVAGISGQMGARNRAAVVAAKSGVIGLTKASALEAAAFGVTVNAISPGLIDTRRSPVLGDQDAADAHYREAAGRVPVGHQGQAADVAALCAFLCGDTAGYITGQIYSVNGGAHM